MTTNHALRSARALGAAAIFSILTVGGASAATFSLVGGTSGVLSGAFNPTGLSAMQADGIDVGTAITIFNGGGNAGGLFVSPENVNITFEFMGKEAGFTDQARLIAGALLFDNTVTPIATSGSIPIDVGANPGPVPFLFRAPGNLDAINGGAIADGLQIAFAKVTDVLFYAFFDDGGAGPDADFDDMVLRIAASSTPGGPGTTPIPGALWLFGSVLAGAAGFKKFRDRRLGAAQGFAAA